MSGTSPFANFDKWQLWNHGVKLRGANIWQTRIDPVRDGNSLGSDPVGPPYSTADFVELAKLGANLVVISHPGVYTEDAPYRADQAAFANLDRLITSIRAADLFAVIAFRTGPGRNEYSLGEPTSGHIVNTVWTDLRAQDAWVSMWRDTARRYRYSGVVVGYNLMVEPNANDVLLHIADPADFYPAYANTLYDWNGLAARLIAAIRAEDPSTPILVGGMNYSEVAWLSSLKDFRDARLVYSVHQYQPDALTRQPDPARSSTGYGPDQAHQKSELTALFREVADFKARRSAVVAVDEFGTTRWAPGATAYLSDEMDIMESAGTNYAMWLWESFYPGVSYDDFNFRKGPDSSVHGDVVPNSLTDALTHHFSLNRDRPSMYGLK